MRRVTLKKILKIVVNLRIFPNPLMLNLIIPPYVHTMLCNILLTGLRSKTKHESGVLHLLNSPDLSHQVFILANIELIFMDFSY